MSNKKEESRALEYKRKFFTSFSDVSDDARSSKYESPEKRINLMDERPKRGRMKWTAYMHEIFVNAINHYRDLGLGEPTPYKILQYMNKYSETRPANERHRFRELNRVHVASHLQKYRLKSSCAHSVKEFGLTEVLPTASACIDSYPVINYPQLQHSESIHANVTGTLNFAPDEPPVDCKGSFSDFYSDLQITTNEVDANMDYSPSLVSSSSEDAALEEMLKQTSTTYSENNLLPHLYNAYGKPEGPMDRRQYAAKLLDMSLKLQIKAAELLWDDGGRHDGGHVPDSPWPSALPWVRPKSTMPAVAMPNWIASNSSDWP